MKKNRRMVNHRGFFINKTILFILFAFLVFTSISYAVTIQLAETGQTTCYDSFGSVISCTGTGQDGEIRDGVGWPSPRFTNPDGSVPLSGDIVLDQLTGLMWQRSANCIKVRYPGFDNDGVYADGMVTWQHALDFVKGINNTGGTPGTDYYPLCGGGYSDWRLANIIELDSLINSGAPWPSGPGAWLTSQGFVDGQWGYQTAAFYWSSTSCAHQTDDAWVAEMSLGWTGYGYLPPADKSNAYYVWAVRGTSSGPAELRRTGQTDCYDSSGAVIYCPGTGQDGDLQMGVAWPDPRYTDNGDGTVLDNLTGIMWLQDTDCFGTRTWQNALDAVTNFNFNPVPYNCQNYTALYSDWQMPNRSQLVSITDLSQHQPSLEPRHPFLDVAWGRHWWSSTTYQINPPYAWAMLPEFGPHFLHNTKSSDLLNIWPMRTGLSVSPGNHDFGKIDVGSSAQMTFRLLNSGDADIVTGVISSTDPAQFVPNGCSNTIVSPGEECMFTVDFIPSASGLQQVSVNIPSSEADNPIVVLSLSGIGTHTISGTIAYSGLQTGTIYVVAFASPVTCVGPNTQPTVAEKILSSLGQYTLSGLDDGTYYVASAIVTCGASCDPGDSDPWGMYDGCPVAAPITIANNDVTGIDVTLVDGSCSNSNPFAKDMDNDGVGDTCDNCSLTQNPGQQDTDSDGYGNACDADLDNNGCVGGADFNIFKAAWLSNPSSPNWNPDADMDSNGAVGGSDFNLFKTRWLTCAPWD